MVHGNPERLHCQLSRQPRPAWCSPEVFANTFGRAVASMRSSRHAAKSSQSWWLAELVDDDARVVIRQSEVHGLAQVAGKA